MHHLACHHWSKSQKQNNVKKVVDGPMPENCDVIIFFFIYDQFGADDCFCW